jgi:uncharacterized protein (TIGR00162 family)
MDWEISEVGKIPKMHGAILIEGLPGIGNVGKLAVDFLIEELKAKKIYEFFSYSMPHSVFVNEDNLVDLPKIEMHYALVNGQPILLLSGDTQPIDEVSSYVFSEKVLNIASELGTKEIITIGGIGLPNIPKDPVVFCTGNCQEIISKYKKGTKINNKIFGVVGPIIGVSGLLIGLSKKRNMKAVSLLAETYGHPMYLGMRGAQEVVNVLNFKLGLKVNTKRLKNQVDKLEEITAAEGDIEELPEKKIMRKMRRGFDTNYIG